MRFSYRAPLLICTILLPLAHLHAAEEETLYMWTNEDGVTTFSQTRPRDHSAVEIEKPHPPQPPPPPPPPEVEEILALKDDNARTRALNCMIGRRTLDRLNANENIYMKADDGFFRLLSEERRAAEVAKAQRIIDEWCPRANAQLAAP